MIRRRESAQGRNPVFSVPVPSSTSTNMDQFNHIFAHRPEYRIVICKQCQSGIVPANIPTHLGKHHAEFGSTTRREMVEVAKRIPGLAQASDEVVYPPASSRPVPDLPVWTDGFRCTASTGGDVPCGHVRRRLKHMQTHSREAHGWINPQRRGRPAGRERQHEVPWVANVRCQRFFKTGGFQKLFEVGAERGRERGRDGAEAGGSTAAQAKREFETAWATVGEEKKKRAVDGDQNRYEPNAWLNRAGWARHLSGIEREWLVSLARPPDGEKETGLARACAAVERLIFKA
jgi:hypothetical protein